MTPADFSAIFAQSHRRTIDPRFLAKRQEPFGVIRSTASPCAPSVVGQASAVSGSQEPATEAAVVEPTCFGRFGR